MGLLIARVRSLREIAKLCNERDGELNVNGQESLALCPRIIHTHTHTEYRVL